MAFRVFLSALILALFGSCLARELKQVQFVHRHGDRTPLTVLKTEKVDWEKELGVTPTQLTGLGISQAYDFGTWLRSRYIEQNNLLKPNYYAPEIYVRSTDLDRTLSTATVILESLFRSSSRYDEIHNRNWTHEVPYPVHTVAIVNNVLQAVDMCPKYLHEKLPELYRSQVWQNKEAEEKEFLARFSQETGFTDVKLKDFYHYYDPVYVQHVHSLLKNEWLKDNLEHIVSVADFSETMQKNAGGSLVGGPYLYRFREAMDLVVKGKEDAKKYIQYSAHDSTVMAVLSAFGIFELSGLNQIPPYASALIIELWQEDNGEFTVDVMFRNGVTGTVLSIDSPTHLPHEYAAFHEMLTQKGYSDVDWCSVCAQGTAWVPESAPDTCIRNAANYDDDDDDDEVKMYKHLAVGFICAFLVTAAALVFVLLRQGKRRNRSTVQMHAPLLDEERDHNVV